jgi:hypothetical protein
MFDLHEQIARCEREIAEIRDRKDECAAYLTVLGLNDWEYEKRLLLRELAERGEGSHA